MGERKNVFMVLVGKPEGQNQFENLGMMGG
jgi:hypothetical protein